MPKINPMALLYQTAASDMVKPNTKTDRAINRQFRKLWKKNTYRSVTQQMIIDNELELKRQITSAKKEQITSAKKETIENTIEINEVSERTLINKQISEPYGLVIGTEEVYLPQNSPEKT